MLNRLTVFLPELLNRRNQAEILKQMPALRQLLTDARPNDALYVQTRNKINNLPIASVLAKNLLKSDACKYHIVAECVHIELDQTQGYLKTYSKVDVTETIEQDLQVALSEWVLAHKLEITPIVNRLAWLISAKEPFISQDLLRPDFIFGESIVDKMPLPKHGEFFNWFNELQMMLYRLPSIKTTGVNSFWFWGQGEATVSYDGFITQDWFLSQYAKAYQYKVASDYGLSVFDKCADVIYVDTEINTKMAEDPIHYIQRLDEILFKPLLRDFKRRKINEMIFCFSDAYAYTLNQQFNKKPWLKYLKKLIGK